MALTVQTMEIVVTALALFTYGRTTGWVLRLTDNAVGEEQYMPAAASQPAGGALSNASTRPQVRTIGLGYQHTQRGRVSSFAAQEDISPLHLYIDNSSLL